MFKKLLLFFGNRLREPSTYFGLVTAILGGIGVAYDDGQVQAIAGAIAVIVGIALAAIKERKSPDHPINRGVPDPSIPDAAVVRDDAPDDVQSVDLTRDGPGDARDKWRHRNER